MQPAPISVLKEKFKKAPQVLVTHLDRYKNHPGWMPVKKYPAAFKPKPDEKGMVIERGEIVHRVFS